MKNTNILLNIICCNMVSYNGQLLFSKGLLKVDFDAMKTYEDAYAVVELLKECNTDYYPGGIYYTFESVTRMSQIPKDTRILSCRRITNIGNEVFPENLQHMIIDTVQTTTLDNLPGKLRTLKIENANLTSLDRLPKTLTCFTCFEAPVASLDNLPNGLKHLSYLDDMVINWDNLPQSICGLQVESAELSDSLIPCSVERIDCSIFPYSLPPFSKLGHRKRYEKTKGTTDRSYKTQIKHDIKTSIFGDPFHSCTRKFAMNISKQYARIV